VIPGQILQQQAKPTAWANHSFAELLNDVYSHTFDVLTALKAAGVTQNGYKLGMKFGGMLWPEEVLQIESISTINQ
jgi:arabinogalactan endo-1,4-beta-galactosidase